MKSKPSVSVIIPAYNEEKYIESTLKSVKDQNYSNLELIVVPNGPCTDKTAEVAEKFTPFVYDTKRKGIGLAKNIGFEKANGEVIIFLDGDSKMEEGLVELITKTVKKHYVGGKTKVIPDDNSFGAKLYFGWVDFCGKLSQLFTIISPDKNNGAGACIFSTYDLLHFLKRKDGHVFREDIMTMEDVDLISRIRARGSFKYLTQKGIITSTRRFWEIDKRGEKKSIYLKRFIMDFIEYSNPAKIDDRRDIR